jgi:hypothetical protein
MWDNLGKTKSTGWEFSLSGIIIDKKDLQWTWEVRYLHRRTRSLKLITAWMKTGNRSMISITDGLSGKSINVDYNYVFGGIWQEGETPTPDQYLPGDALPTPGNIRLKDYNGDGKITTDDRKVFNLDPDWYATFNSSLSIKALI